MGGGAGAMGLGSGLGRICLDFLLAVGKLAVLLVDCEFLDLTILPGTGLPELQRLR